MSPLILISNDDGIHSPGLRAMVEAVHSLGEVLVVAPSKQQSGTGSNFFGEEKGTLQPIELVVAGKSISAYHCDCTPAFVVQHGMAVLCQDRLPDLMISGCNYGENLGADVFVSGTLGAALQAALKGIAAVAVSLETDYQYHRKYGQIDWTTAIHFTHYFAQRMLAQQLPFDMDILKIDIPRNATATTPWKVANLAKTSHFGYALQSPTPTSTLDEVGFYPRHNEESLQKGTDLHTFWVKRLVSVTPLSLDLTARVDQKRLLEFFSNADHESTET